MVSAEAQESSTNAMYVTEQVFLQDIVTVTVVPMIAWVSAVEMLK